MFKLSKKLSQTLKYFRIYQKYFQFNGEQLETNLDLDFTKLRSSAGNFDGISSASKVHQSFCLLLRTFTDVQRALCFYLRNKTREHRRSESRSPRRNDSRRDDHKRRRAKEDDRSSGRVHSRRSSDDSDSDVEIRKKDSSIHMKTELPLEPVVGKVQSI